MRIKFLPFDRKHKCVAGYLNKLIYLDNAFDLHPGTKAIIFFIRKKGNSCNYKIAVAIYDNPYGNKSLEESIERIKKNLNLELYQTAEFNYQKEDIKLFRRDKFSMRIIKREKNYYLDGFHRNTWYNSVELFNEFELKLFERYLRN
jgi:hypothetical protein